MTTIRYGKARFTIHLPVDRLYTPSHYWLQEEAPGLWRVGLTGFAERLLGDLVEYELCVRDGEPLEVGQTVGWIEGFKAISDLYSVVDGAFAAGNSALDEDVTLFETDPHGAGWLYRARGAPESTAVDVEGYMRTLDSTIDRMLASQ